MSGGGAGDLTTKPSTKDEVKRRAQERRDKETAERIKALAEAAEEIRQAQKTVDAAQTSAEADADQAAGKNAKVNEVTFFLSQEGDKNDEGGVEPEADQSNDQAHAPSSQDDNGSAKDLSQ